MFERQIVTEQYQDSPFFKSNANFKEGEDTIQGAQNLELGNTMETVKPIERPTDTQIKLLVNKCTYVSVEFIF